MPLPWCYPSTVNSTCYLADNETETSLHGLLGFDMYKNCTTGIHRQGKKPRKLISCVDSAWIFLPADSYPDHNFAVNIKWYIPAWMSYITIRISSPTCTARWLNRPNIINDYSISKWRTVVMIINTGRGQLIHTNALIGWRTENKKIGSAGCVRRGKRILLWRPIDKIIETILYVLNNNVTSHHCKPSFSFMNQWGTGQHSSVCFPQPCRT